MPSIDSTLLNNIGSSITTVQGIINEEKDRLDKKKLSIQQAEDNQNRLILLNQNYSSRVNQYIKMILVIVVTLGLLLIIRSYMHFLSEPVINLLCVIIIAVTLFFLFNLKLLNVFF